MNKDFIFFTFNNFSLTDGGTIRMNGILESLRDHGSDVTLISNSTKNKNTTDGINKINLNLNYSKNQRRIFLLCLTVLPLPIVKFLYRKNINKVVKIFKKNNFEKREIIFFEYFDNSFGYVLSKIIDVNLVLDVHGIADLEFKYKNPENIFSLLNNKIKYFLSLFLDRKVFSGAYKVIALNTLFRDYLIKKYKFLNSSMFYIVDDGLSSSLNEQKININLQNQLKTSLKIDNSIKVIFFAGYFKSLGGVPDLVSAFHQCLDQIKNIKLVLVGDGEDYEEIKEYIDKNKIEDKVFLLGRCDYGDLKTYQSIADIIVCPDRMHPYSELIVHTKYYEALSTGKVVINGSFKPVLEINPDERLSLVFKPSNINDLSNKIMYALENYEELKSKYSKNVEIVPKNFSYSSAVLGFFNNE